MGMFSEPTFPVPESRTTIASFTAPSMSGIEIGQLTPLLSY
jgi:hypothetical protein